MLEMVCERECMALSNSERQARFRQRLREAARQGVTADDVVRVGRLVIEQAIAEQPDFAADWEEWLAANRKKRRGAEQWADVFSWLRPDDIDDGEYGDDTDLVRRVAVVAQALFRLPEK